VTQEALVADEDLGQLLAQGERAAFHGPPGKAVDALSRAIELAHSTGNTDASTAALWLMGVALGACGRYGAGVTTLTPVLESGETAVAPSARLFGALAGASLGSIHRQLGRHAEARAFDERGLALTGGAGEAAFACLLGLAADAVGLNDSATAHKQADAAEALLPDRPTEWWRQRVRLDWVRAEIALLDEDPETAVDAAESAVERAERARAPRHVAKSLLFQGVAKIQHGDLDGATALRRAATLAEGLGALPLVWPSRALLGALLADSDPAESASSLGAARSAVMAIAGDLPDGMREDWLARDEIAALLGA
jgi:tetratricopeptide (TPR) repeat protein